MLSLFFIFRECEAQAGPPLYTMSRTSKNLSNSPLSNQKIIPTFATGMAILSVNINKVATLRNARGGNVPDVEQFALDCERFGAEGITVHPRPDERHIRHTDVYQLKQILTKEFNIEGNPTDDFCNLVCSVCPTQVTLVPDDPQQLTSNHGWDTIQYFRHLQTLTNRFHEKNIRVSVFVDPNPDMVSHAAQLGADRVELYTGPYAELFEQYPQKAVEMYAPAAKMAKQMHIGLNAGHELNLKNLQPLIAAFPWIDEVSIGHALIADALYLGIEQTIQRYRKLAHNE